MAKNDKLLRRVRMVIFDFDGVFTDNMVYVFDDGKEAVRCCRSDGIGITKLKKFGITPIVISGEPNPVVQKRCRKLKLKCISNCRDKLKAMRSMARKCGLSLGQIAFVGNDVNDAECLAHAGFPIVVSDARVELKRLAKYITQAKGGDGAVREVCEKLVNNAI